MSEQLIYDFKNGRGPIPAHQHVNPDGTIGGWVADTATVEPTVHIGPKAKVYGKAQIYGHATILDNARIYGHAHVADSAQIVQHARVGDKAQIYGNARISGKARIYGNARIYGDAHVYGCARIYDDAKISGNASINGYAFIRSNAIIEDTDNYIVIGPLGSDDRYTTFTRYPVIQATTGCFTGTLDEFLKAVEAKHRNNHLGKKYKETIEYIKRIWK